MPAGTSSVANVQFALGINSNGCLRSVDAWRYGWKDRPVPLWNYTAVRTQFFLLYFLAGVKKFDTDWLGGFPMRHLNSHWVFDPFK